MSVERQPYLTPEQYLERERKAETKSEYYAGEMFAMSGTTRDHNRIAVDAVGELRDQLRDSPCEPFALDMRVKVSPTGLYTYPDVVVVCGEAEFEDAEVDTLLNPILIVEVLSESTEACDRGRKFEQYRTLESFQEYVLIAQDRPHVERFRRQGQAWVMTEISGLDGQLVLESIGCSLALRDIYRRVQFPPSPDTASEP